MKRFYVSNDVSALAAGADRVAVALARKGATVVRTSSRGAFFLEPLVEMDGPGGRVAWSNAAEKDAAKILAGRGATPVDQIPFLARQTRFTFARAGFIDPVSIEDFKSRGGFKGLQKALAMDPQKIVDEVKASGLRGRGGAAFPAGVKWQTTKDASADQKYVVANADEGDPGTYSDRMIMEGEPYRLIEGMAICARAVGATKGYIYARSEYPHAIRKLRAAIARATEAGWLGHKIQGAAFDFELEVFVGAGAYICGEETALLESLEGKRGMVRPKPPFPAIEGLHRKPTVVNNVITFATAPDILDRGGAWHASMGSEKSKGTMPLQLAGCVRQGGLVEIPFGITLESAIYDFGGGLPKGSKFKAVQVGGPLGSIFPEKLLKTPICFDEFAKAGGILGHGGIVVFDHETDMVDLARHFMEFTAEESCGKCTPCRVGSTRAREILEQIRDGKGRPEDLETLKDLGDTMKMTSLCALGGLAPFPVLTALQYFPKEFERKPRAR
ncbi:MAG TPA: NADH-ubiquinone oxidoreductase-F iron-sulfur binding region domain-containing protein [Planctomycetota bacterium]|nr:NADH-ubiquinone oxidoreductase-F iron-sulfur binding region domain-containing protein [Planctomycetota bacterium]